MVLARTAAAALALVLAAPQARAGDALTPLEYSWAVDGAVTGVAVVATGTLMLMRNELAPRACKWCEPGSLDGEIARAVAWSSPRAANTTSDVLQWVVPVGMLGYGLAQAYRLGNPTAGWSDVLIVAEATSVAMLINTVVKYAVGRARPYAWTGDDPYGETTDANLSFFSGHSTFAFAVSVSAGTVYLMQGMPGAPAALGAGLVLSAFTAYLRMAAEQHYLTDVLAGAALGSLVGWAVPFLFHRPAKASATAAPAVVLPTGGFALAF